MLILNDEHFKYVYIYLQIYGKQFFNKIPSKRTMI